MGSHYALAEDVELIAAEDGYVVYQPSRDQVHHLNAAAALILELCTSGHSSDDIAPLVQEAFGLEALPTVEVADVLAMLAAQEIIVRQPTEQA